MINLTLLISLLKIRVDPNNPFSKFERMATSVVYAKEHTLPFTLENLEQLWTPRRSRISLSIKNESSGDSPDRGLKSMKTLKNHLTSYGNGLLLQGLAWIEV
jgi:hypothetical protein